MHEYCRAEESRINLLLVGTSGAVFLDCYQAKYDGLKEAQNHWRKLLEENGVSAEVLFTFILEANPKFARSLG